MTTNEKQAKILRETAAKLLKQADELEAGIDRNKCIHGEYTNELFNTHGCKTCGAPKLVICSNLKITAKKRNGKLCNKQSCKHFNILKLNT
jgi:hypothetical protein